MREYDKKIAEGEAKARALTQQRELREMDREAEPTSSSAVDQGSESSFSSMSVSDQLTCTCNTNKQRLIKWC